MVSNATQIPPFACTKQYNTDLQFRVPFSIGHCVLNNAFTDRKKMRPTYDAFATSQSALEMPNADWWRGPSLAVHYTLFSLNMCVSADAAHGLLPFFVMLKARERTPLGHGKE